MVRTHKGSWRSQKWQKRSAHTHGDTIESIESKHCCCDFDSSVRGNLRRCLRGSGSGDRSAARSEGHRAWEDETAGALLLDKLSLILFGNLFVFCWLQSESISHFHSEKVKSCEFRVILVTFRDSWQAKHQALVESPLCEIRFAEMMCLGGNGRQTWQVKALSFFQSGYFSGEGSYSALKKGRVGSLCRDAFADVAAMSRCIYRFAW